MPNEELPKTEDAMSLLTEGASAECTGLGRTGLIYTPPRKSNYPAAYGLLKELEKMKKDSKKKPSKVGLDTPSEISVELPKYVERAITSKTARSGNYGFLTQEEWKELAQHIYRDEFIQIPESDLSPLPRGNLSSSGRGRKATLDRILSSAVHNHSSILVSGSISNYDRVEFVYRANLFGVKIEK